jgi:hypothetical protein
MLALLLPTPLAETMRGGYTPRAGPRGRACRDGLWLAPPAKEWQARMLLWSVWSRAVEGFTYAG